MTTEMDNLLKTLNTPRKIQEYIDKEIEYDPYREDRSIVEVIRDKKAECFNGALFACACLLANNFESVGLVELSAHEDEEHILAIYKVNGLFGAIAQSKFLGLKSREPIYMNIHDLAVSYKEFYFAFDGRYSLVSYSDPIYFRSLKDLVDMDKPSIANLAKQLSNSNKTIIMNSDFTYYVEPKRYWQEVEFIPEGTKIPDSYLRFRGQK